MSYYIHHRGLIPKILSTVIVTGISGLIGFLILFIAFFYGLFNHYIVLSLCGLLLLTATLLFFIWNRSFVYQYLRLFLIGGLLFLAVVVGFIIGDISNQQMPVIRENMQTNSLELKNSLKEASFQQVLALPLPQGAGHPYFAPLTTALASQTNLKNTFVKGNPSDSPDLYENLIQGDVDFIISSAPTEQEKQRAAEKGLTFILTPIAKEGIVFYVNKENPLENLTFEDLREIYSGKVTKWQKFNQKNDEIIPFQRSEDSLSQQALIRVMNGRPLMQPPTAEFLESRSTTLRQISDYKNLPNAIGFSSRIYALPLLKQNEIKFLTINGIYPEEKNIQSDSYPFTEVIYFVTTEKSYENPNVNLLIQWLTSPEGKELIQQVGYIPHP